MRSAQIEDQSRKVSGRPVGWFPIADFAWLQGTARLGDDCAQMDQLCAFVLGVRHGFIFLIPSVVCVTHSNAAPCRGSARR